MDIFINEEDEKNSVLLRDDMINTYAKGRIAMVYVTDRAKFLASHICDEMHKKCHSDDNIDIIDIKTFRLDVKSCFLKYDLIIFIMATGIAVRTIAPYLVDKYIDPAVLVIDDMGNNVISLLGGHMAGANEYAKFIAEKIGAEAIITTATDINKKGAFDLLVKKIGAKLENLRELSLKYNTELLNDMGPYLFVDPDIEGLVKSIPRWDDVTRGFRDYKLHTMADMQDNRDLDKDCDIILISDKKDIGILNLPNACNIVKLVPKINVLGTGCRKNIDSEQYRRTVMEYLDYSNVDIGSIVELASIELKSDRKSVV